MTNKDKEDMRIQKAVNNATGALNNKFKNLQSASDRMIGSLSSKLKAAQATIAGRDATIEDLNREITNLKFAIGWRKEK